MRDQAVTSYLRRTLSVMQARRCHAKRAIKSITPGCGDGPWRAWRRPCSSALQFWRTK